MSAPQASRRRPLMPDGNRLLFKGYGLGRIERDWNVGCVFLAQKSRFRFAVCSQFCQQYILLTDRPALIRDNIKPWLWVHADIDSLTFELFAQSDVGDLGALAADAARSEPSPLE